jgi:hypothetical protein
LDLSIGTVKGFKVGPIKDEPDLRRVSITVEAIVLPETAGEVAAFVGRNVVVSLDVLQRELPTVAHGKAPNSGACPFGAEGEVARVHPTGGDGA